MEPQIDQIKELMRRRNWNASELARQMGVSRSEAHRFLNGKRNGGRKVIEGLIKAFPDEPLETLFFLRISYPNGNTHSNSVPLKKLSDNTDPMPVKHPDAHQLACTVSQKEGRIDIKQGKCLTTILIPPGPVDVSYSKTE